MPQMMPMLWMYMYTYSIMSLMLTICLIYYLNLPPLSFYKSSPYYMLTYWIWKW
nr:ATP synthase F0 subunit 8 [Hypoponera sauteri]